MGVCGSEPRRTSSKQNDTATEPSPGARVLGVSKIPDAKYQVAVNATCAHCPFHRLPEEPVFLACYSGWNSGFYNLCQLKIRKLLSIPLLSVKCNHFTWLLVTFFIYFLHVLQHALCKVLGINTPANGGTTAPGYGGHGRGVHRWAS